MYLEQAGGAHAAADAHGDDRALRLAAAAFDQDMPGHARAAQAVRMPDGDGAAIDIELVRRNAEAVAAVQHLTGERFVELPQVDVVHGEPLLLEQLRYGEDGADAHLVRLAAGDRDAAERAE